jgi:sugar phosphate isomerase/epimerase
MWDLSHAPMLGESPEDLRRAKGFLAHIHVGCSKKTDGTYVDSHPGFYVKGAVNSEDDVARLLQVLLEINYDGMIGFEVKPEPQQTSEEIVNTAKGVLTSAYQKVVLDSLKK